MDNKITSITRHTNGEETEIYPQPIQDKPQFPGDWTLAQIEEKLSRPLPPSLLSQKFLKGNRISFLTWHMATKILCKYCPGWQWEITHLHAANNRLFLIGTLSIPTKDCGMVARAATGTEEMDCSNYGDPSSNAESMAFRRAAAKFGLGLYLYQK